MTPDTAAQKEGFEYNTDTDDVLDNCNVFIFIWVVTVMHLSLFIFWQWECGAVTQTKQVDLKLS